MNRDNEQIAKMMGAKLVKNGCPDYFVWKFPDKEEAKREGLSEFEEDLSKLTSPTWKDLKFDSDWNRCILATRVAKKRYKSMQHDSKKMDLLSISIDLLKCLENLEITDVYRELVKFSKIYNEK